MKKSILLITLSVTIALLASCTRELTDQLGEIQPQLNMNAQLKVGDSLHIVHLCLSTDKTLLPIQSASVRCLVNGKPVATAVKVDGDRYEVPQVEQYFMSYFSFAPSKLRQSSYGFEADFREGDKVRIEAEADGHAVWSEVIVPKAPEFEVADTSYAVDPDSYYESQGKKIYNKLMKIRLKGRDNIDGPNHYRLWGTLKSDDLVYLREFNRDPDEIPEVKTDRVMYETGIRIRWKNDPILNDGAPAEDLDLFGAGQNIYNAFSDNLFSDGSFELNVMVPKSQLEYIDEKIFWGEDGKTLVPVDSIFAVKKLEICLSAISEQDYHQLKSLNIKANVIDEGLFFTEPITFPDNVEGGVGLISIETPTKRAISLEGFMRSFLYFGEKD